MEWLPIVPAAETVAAGIVLALMYAPGVPAIATRLSRTCPWLNCVNLGCGMLAGYFFTVIVAFATMPPKLLSVPSISLVVATVVTLAVIRSLGRAEARLFEELVRCLYNTDLTAKEKSK